jgi:hypothetical protein
MKRILDEIRLIPIGCNHLDTNDTGRIHFTYDIPAIPDRHNSSMLLVAIT